jgi:ribosomal protein S16
MIWLRENGLTGRDGHLSHAYLRHNFDRDSYLSTQMVRLAEDGRCSQLLGFYETSSKLRVYGETLRVACKSVRIEKPNSGAQLTSQSRQLMVQANDLLL